MHGVARCSNLLLVLVACCFCWVLLVVVLPGWLLSFEVFIGWLLVAAVGSNFCYISCGYCRFLFVG